MRAVICDDSLIPHSRPIPVFHIDRAQSGAQAEAQPKVSRRGWDKALSTSDRACPYVCA
jgi:hypothetical protein